MLGWDKIGQSIGPLHQENQRNIPVLILLSLATEGASHSDGSLGSFPVSVWPLPFLSLAAWLNEGDEHTHTQRT